ncbi:MAG: hypothetical protein ACI8X5_003860 [Planctomycetota bacterium]|jgi:hypothetical protein
MIHLIAAQVLALSGATVHTMEPGSEPRIMTVLMEDGFFTEIGADLEIPEGAEVLDLSGKHLFPGLLDGMVHHDMEHDPLYLLSGVTFIRDTGNELSSVLLAAMPNMRNRMPGPDLWVAGSIFDGVPPATTDAVIVRTKEDVEDKLPRLKERGIRFASYHTGVPAPAWRRLIELGNLHKLQVWGPIPASATLDEVLTSGQSGLSYLEGFQDPDSEWDAELAHERVLDYKRNEIASMPLLHVYAYRTEDQGDDPPIFNFMAPYYADWWRSDLGYRRKLFNPEYLAAGREAHARLEGLVLDLWKSGVALVPGSAAPNPWMGPGEGLHDELDAWVAAGIPQADVLQMATHGAAQAMGIELAYGTIATGRVASAIVLDEDPTQNIKLLREPKGLVLRGTYLSPEYLDNLRGGLHRAQVIATAGAEAPLSIEKPYLPEGQVVLEGRVEGTAFDRVVAAEDYWVVRGYDGQTVWVARMVLAGSLSSTASRTTITQRFKDNKLDSFLLFIENGESNYKVEGLTVGGHFRLKRWVNDIYVDTNSTTRGPTLVDAGMALPAMILSHYQKDGLCQAVYFEGTEPNLSGWEVQRTPTGVLAIKTGRGPMVATFEENGALDKLERVAGKASVRYEAVHQNSFGGPGMPPIPPSEPETVDQDRDEEGE